MGWIIGGKMRLKGVMGLALILSGCMAEDDYSKSVDRYEEFFRADLRAAIHQEILCRMADGWNEDLFQRKPDKNDIPIESCEAASNIVSQAIRDGRAVKEEQNQELIAWLIEEGYLNTNQYDAEKGTFRAFRWVLSEVPADSPVLMEESWGSDEDASE